MRVSPQMIRPSGVSFTDAPQSLVEPLRKEFLHSDYFRVAFKELPSPRVTLKEVQTFEVHGKKRATAEATVSQKLANGGSIEAKMALDYGLVEGKWKLDQRPRKQHVFVPPASIEAGSKLLARMVRAATKKGLAEAFRFQLKKTFEPRAHGNSVGVVTYLDTAAVNGTRFGEAYYVQGQTHDGVVKLTHGGYDNWIEDLDGRQIE